VSLRTKREGRLLRITLDRPEKRNALNSDLCRELLARMEEADADRGIGAILLDAAGSIFCSGMDLEESLLPDAADRNALHKSLFSLGQRIHTPLIASVHGAALAGGIGLVATAHIALSSEDAWFSLPEIRIGMFPFVLWRPLVLAIGERRALELSLTGRKFAAPEAVAMGLVHGIIPATELATRAEGLAHELSERSPEAVRRGLALVHESREMSLNDALDHADRLRARMFQSPDYREGVWAFQEKRQPRWPSLQEE